MTAVYTETMARLDKEKIPFVVVSQGHYRISIAKITVDYWSVSGLFRVSNRQGYMRGLPSLVRECKRLKKVHT